MEYLDPPSHVLNKAVGAQIPHLDKKVAGGRTHSHLCILKPKKFGPDTKVLTVGGEYRSLEKGNEFKCLLLQTLGNSI